MYPVRDALNRIISDANLAISLLPPESITVKAGENLQTALDTGGTINLEAANYPGPFQIRKSNTVINGNNAKLISQSNQLPALDIPTGINGVTLNSLSGDTPWDQCVFQVGRNDSTQTLDNIPTDIYFNKVSVGDYTGKVAFRMCATKFGLSECKTGWISHPKSDSQAIVFLNTPGNGIVDHCDLTAASEIILFGGDTRKIQSSIKNVQILNNHLFRDIAKMGGPDIVKTILEIKDGEDIIVQNNIMEGCWKDDQDGWAITLTPRLDGTVKNIHIDSNSILSCGGGLNIMGMNNSSPTSYPTTNVFVTRNRFNIESGRFGGRGILALLTTEVQYLSIDDNDIQLDGNAIIQAYFGSALLPDGTSRKTGKFGSLNFVNNRSNTGAYGLIGTGTTAGATWENAFSVVPHIENNTLRGASSAFKRNFPVNVWI
jgi:hypothetical protein